MKVPAGKRRVVVELIAEVRDFHGGSSYHLHTQSVTLIVPEAAVLAFDDQKLIHEDALKAKLDKIGNAPLAPLHDAPSPIVVAFGQVIAAIATLSGDQRKRVLQSVATLMDIR